MNMASCIVCKEKVNGEDQCPRCGFPMRAPYFLSMRQCQEWMKNDVTAYRMRYLREEVEKYSVSAEEKQEIFRRESAGSIRVFVSGWAGDLLRGVKAVYAETNRSAFQKAIRREEEKIRNILGNNLKREDSRLIRNSMQKTLNQNLRQAEEALERKDREISGQVETLILEIQSAVEENVLAEYAGEKFWWKLKNGGSGGAVKAGLPEEDHVQESRNQLLEIVNRILPGELQKHEQDFRGTAERLYRDCWDEQEKTLERDLRSITREQELKTQRESARKKLEQFRRDSTFCGAYGFDFFVMVNNDGTVNFSGEDMLLQAEVESWGNIVAVAAGNSHLAGLRQDGTVVAAGANDREQCDVSQWKNIRQIAACGKRTAALDQEGRVWVCGDYDYNLHAAQQWTSIKKIALADNHILGLRSDGTVLWAGSDEDGQCGSVLNWSDITDIAVGTRHSLGLKKDGTVVSSGMEFQNECQVSGWKEVILIQAAEGISLGYTRNGEILQAGEGHFETDASPVEKTANFVLSRDGSELSLMEAEQTSSGMVLTRNISTYIDDI